MESLIEKIVQKLHSLPEAEIAEVLDFVEFLAWNKERSTAQELATNTVREDEEFEEIADHLADEFQMLVGANAPVLSDYAVSRAGIYEEHP